MKTVTDDALTPEEQVWNDLKAAFVLARTFTNNSKLFRAALVNRILGLLEQEQRQLREANGGICAYATDTPAQRTEFHKLVWNALIASHEVKEYLKSVPQNGNP